MPNHRLIAPARAASPITVFGTTYAQVPGGVTDCPSGHVATLVQAGWTYVSLSGTTAQRPSQSVVLAGIDGLAPGLEYHDTTLNLCIFYDGITWRNPATGAAI